MSGMYQSAIDVPVMCFCDHKKHNDGQFKCQPTPDLSGHSFMAYVARIVHRVRRSNGGLWNKKKKSYSHGIWMGRCTFFQEEEDFFSHIQPSLIR